MDNGKGEEVDEQSDDDFPAGIEGLPSREGKRETSLLLTKSSLSLPIPSEMVVLDRFKSVP